MVCAEEKKEDAALYPLAEKRGILTLKIGRTGKEVASQTKSQKKNEPHGQRPWYREKVGNAKAHGEEAVLVLRSWRR